jgi:AraC-like DNA-binding protein
MKRILLVCIIVFIYSHTINAMDIDLTAHNAYVSRGFKIQWATSFDEKDSHWRTISANKGNRPLRMRDLMVKNAGYFTPLLPMKTEHFTIVIPFTIKNIKSIQKDAALFLGQIGLNWEIYLNGTSIAREIHINENTIKVEKAVRNRLVYIKRDLLKEGKNILVFHIIGDPSDDRTGLFMTRGYKIGFYENLVPLTQDPIELMFIAIYIFVAISHLIIFFHRREDTFNAFFGIAVLMLSLYLFCRTTTVYQVISNTAYIKDLEFLGSFTGMAFFIASLGRLLQKRYTIVVKLYFIVNILMAITQIFYFQSQLLHLWYIMMPLGLLYILVFDILYPLFQTAREKLKPENRTSEDSVLKIIFKTLTSSLSGKLLLGVLAIMIFSPVDIILMHSGHSGNYSLFSFSFIIIGTSFIIASDLVTLYRLNEDMNQLLEEKVNKRTRELLFSEISRSLFSEAITGISGTDKTSDFSSTAENSILHLSQDPGILGDLESLLSGLGEKLMDFFAAKGFKMILDVEGYSPMKVTGGEIPDDTTSKKDLFTKAKTYIISKDEKTLIAAIFLQDIVSGICYIYRQSGEFTKGDGDLAAGFMRQSSYVINNALMYQNLMNKAHQDRKKKLASNAEEKVQGAVDYIQKNYTYDISREGLAAFLDINSDNLGKAFKIITGKKINDYINELRIHDAAEKLLQTDDRIIDIAYSVGFESLTTFNRIFQKIIQKSPTEYRKQSH